MLRSTWREALAALAVGLAGPWAGAQAQEVPAVDAEGRPAAADELRAERDRLWDDAKRLRNEGKLAEAAAAGERMLAIERQWLGEDHAEIVVSLEWLARVYKQAEDWTSAAARRRDALAWREAHQGVEHQETVDARLALLRAERDRLWDEAQRLRDEGKLAEAAAAAERMLAIERQWLGEDDGEVVYSIEWLAGVYEQAEDWPSAAARRREALAWREAHQEAGHWETVDARLALAHVQLLQGLSAEDRQRLADAAVKNQQALEFYDQGRPAEAIALANEALAIRREILGEEHRDTAQSLSNLGGLLRNLGDFAAAQPYDEQALAIRRKVLGEDHPVTALSLNNLGVLLQDRAAYAGARRYLERALAIRRKILGDEHRDTAQSLSNLGMLLEAMGDYAGAWPFLEQALAIYRKVLGEENRDTARLLSNLGTLLCSMGDHAAARPYFEQALAIRRKVLREDHPDTAYSLNNLGGLLLDMGDYAGARPYYEEALAIRREILGEEHLDTSVSLNNLGILLQATGDYAAACPYLEQALAIRRKALGEEHPDVATSLNNLGGVLLDMGDYAGARPYYEDVLAIRRKVLGEEHPLTAQSLNNLGFLLSSMGDDAGARPYLEQALLIVMMLVDDTALTQHETGQLRMSQDLRYFLHNYLSMLLRSGGDAGAAYQALLGWKGSVLVRQRAARLAAGEPELAQIIAELQAVVRQRSALLMAAAAYEPRWKEQLDELTAHKERLERQLSGQSAAFRAAAEQVQIAALQHALPVEAALVDYFEFRYSEPSADAPGTIDWRRSLVAFVVRAGGAVEIFDLGETEPIYAAVDQWRTSYGLSAEAQQAGALLRERLWAPLEEALGEASLVLISPDMALGTLPFAALPGAAPGTYLIEDVALAIVPAPRLIPELLARAPGLAAGEQDLLVVGGVDYDLRAAAFADANETPGGDLSTDELQDLYAVARSRGAVQRAAEGMQWSALPGAAREAAAISELFAAVGAAAGEEIAVLGGAAATEERFRELAPRQRILHLATHGFFAPEDGQSGLVLAEANHPPELPDDPAEFANLPEDGILTAEELAFLPLGGVELVVMSACETGLGAAEGGQGLLGIQRAFQMSGARTTVASLWKVDDAWTERLMTLFYRNALEKKQSYLEALRNAQLDILHELREHDRTVDGDDVRGTDAPGGPAAASSPYYWAAFTLSGDWR